MASEPDPDPPGDDGRMVFTLLCLTMAVGLVVGFAAGVFWPG